MSVILKNSLLLLFFLSASISLTGQERYYRKGLKYYDKELYHQALEEFYLDKFADNNKDLLVKRIISNYHVNNINAAKRDVQNVLSFESIPDEIFLYIAKIYHAELNFEKAIEYYKNYLKRTGKNDPFRKMAIDEIKRCSVGMSLKFYEQLAFVENMGPEINTIFEETDPVQSPNHFNKFYFSSNRSDSEGGLRDEKGLKDDVYGHYKLDMYTATLENGKWVDIKALNTLLNTARNERVLDFNEDGSILFFMKGDDYKKGAIYVDTFGIQKSEVYPPLFKSPINGEMGDTDLYFFNDSTILFSSKRKGGYGGYDLYVTYRREGYRWSTPKNLGSEINSSYDEVTPFVTKDGMNLYFSSNSKKSIGGFDIFKSQYSYESGTWSTPENQKIGINSANNDTHYRISADGQSSYFRSDRKSGIGKGDLYIAYLKDQELSQLSYTPILPFIANDEIIRSLASNSGPKIKNGSVAPTTAPSKDPDEIIREVVIDNLYYTNDENLFTPAGGKNLENILNILKIYPTTKLKISCFSVNESQVAYELYFTLKRAEKLQSYFEENGIRKGRIMVRAFGSNYPMVREFYAGRANTLAQKLNRRLEFRILETESLPLKIEYIEPVVADYLKAGTNELYNTVVQGLSYKIELARVRQMYQNKILNQYQDVAIEKYFGSDDYIYTIGIFKSYMDARDTLKLLEEDNISGAFIVPYIDNIRLNNDEVLEMAIKHPDLVNYLQYSGQ